MSRRTEDLLRRMTVAEKVAQLVGLWMRFDPDAGERGEFVPHPSTFGAPVEGAPGGIEHGLGQVTRLFGSAVVEPGEGARLADGVQRRLIEGTRLGIPAIIHEECLTGFMTYRATAFPCPLNWGSTWDPSLIEEVGRAIGEQMRSVGAHQGLAPVLDVIRDARWGRTEECIAEDPYLVGTIGSAYIRGLQSARVVATAKHFAGYSFSEGGRNLAPAHVGPRDLADMFLVPFEMAVREGGVRSVMNAYQDNDGVPMAASRRLLTDVLRDEWGFDGIVVADYGSIGFLQDLHCVASDRAGAARLALHAGIDVELPNPEAYLTLGDSEDLDLAVRRVLAVKEWLGLFDDPFAHSDGVTTDLDPPAHRALARRVAERSVVLLRNHGDLLPLPSTASVALIGPNADSARSVLGNYTFENHVASHLPDPLPGPEVITVAAGISEVAAGPVVVVPGCDVAGDDTSGFAAAIDAAAAADVAVLVVGDLAGHFGSGTSGEGTDTDDLSLPGVQQQLVEAVVATGTPTVVVLVTGRPYAVPWIAEHVPAVVATWFPGEEAGRAVADVLYGRVNPSGRSPVTWSRGAGQQPLFYNDRPLGRVGYARSSTRPVFPFGHGLSYTTFAYSDLSIAPEGPGTGEDMTIALRVTNTGERAGDEVVQLYVRDLVASVTRPIQELKGFARVTLDAGETAAVTFALPSDQLSFTGVDLQRVVEPGTIEIMVGSSCADIRLRERLELQGPVRVVGPGRRLVTSAMVAPV